MLLSGDSESSKKNLKFKMIEQIKFSTYFLFFFHSISFKKSTTCVVLHSTRYKKKVGEMKSTKLLENEIQNILVAQDMK